MESMGRIGEHAINIDPGDGFIGDGGGRHLPRVSGYPRRYVDGFRGRKENVPYGDTDGGDAESGIR